MLRRSRMGSGTMKSMEHVYSAGGCAVCGDGSDVVFLWSDRQGVFTYCPACDIAWAAKPIPLVAERLDRLDVFCPGPFRLATQDDLIKTGRAHEIDTSRDATWSLEMIEARMCDHARRKRGMK